MIITAGKTSVSVYFYIVQDASATSPGEPVTGLLFSDIETGGSASYARQGAARVDLTLITLASASAAYAEGGFILVDDTNMPGLYRCDYPDAAFVTGVDQAMLQIVVASAKNAVASPIFVEITDVDLRDAVRGGMTALPNAAADAAGGLTISDAGGLDMDDIPITAEFDARTIVSANYATASNLATVDTVVDAIKAVTDNLPDSGSLNDLALILTDTGTTLDTKLNDIQGATFSTSTDSLEAIRDRGDAAWTTGAGGSDKLVLADTTIATLATQTSFTLTAGSADNDAYNNCTIVVEDVSTAVQKAVGMVLDYVGSSKTVTLKEALAFTIATTDKVYILAENSLKSTVVNRQLDVTATGEAEADITAISGDSTAADNLELMYDGTGLTGDTFPSTQSQLGGIANVGSAVHKPAASYVLTTGTQSSGTVSSTEALDNVNHEHTDDTGVLELYYEFLIGSGTASSCQVTGYVTGNNDDVDVFGFDWVTSGFKQIGNIQGGSASNNVHSFDLFVDMVGSGSDEGKVRVQFFKASGLTSATLAIDQIFVAFSQGAEGYDNGAVWADSGRANTNTEVGIDGVARNTVSTVGAVNTLLASTNLHRVEVAPGSSFTFAAGQTDEIWTGRDWTLVLGSQDISGSFIFGATVSGVGVATAEYEFEECDIGAVTMDNDGHFERCGLEGTFTVGQAGSFVFHDCFTEEPGGIVLDFGALGATTIHLFGFDGDVTPTNMATGDLLHVTGAGSITTATCTGGTIDHDGFFEYVDAGGNVTEQQSDIKVAVDATLVDTADIQPKIGTPAADVSADIAAVKVDTAAILVDTAVIGAAGAGLTDLGGMSSGMKAEILTEVVKLLVTQMTESYAADGVAPTMTQALMLTQQSVQEFAIVTTTRTVKKLDGSTTAATFTLDDATNPTSTTRAT